MSKAHRRTKRKRQETGALQILEEAFHLVRSADIKATWIFYLGAVPWSVGLLFFVADMGRSSFAQRDAGLAVGGMVVLWLWMKYTQARYCAMLWDRLSPGHLPNPRKMDRLRALAAFWLLEAFQIPLVVVGCFFAVPLGWIVAMERNFVVLALTQKPGPAPLRSLLGRSIRYSHEQWAQNHAILVVLFFVALFTWVNLFATAVFLPDLIKMAFGVDSVFTLSPQAAMLNSTFLLGTLLLVQLAVVPLMNAAYVLRCFYASSRTSGADLLSRLAACRESWTEQERRERGPLGSKVAAISLLLVCLQAGSLRAEEATVAPVAPVAEQRTAGSGGDSFRREIDRTLEQKKYQWRLSRRQIEQGAMPEETWLGRQLKDIAESVKRAMKALEEWIGKSIRRLFERGSPGQKGDSQKGRDLFEKIGSTASVALVVLILGLLVWLTVSLYRKYRGREVEEVAETGRGGPIDLESEDIVATQLREDEWMRLAREQIEKGEERLAIRALFLATLAHLGERGLIRIYRSKSNRDYRSEVALRARSLSELRQAFDENTILFERVWYGTHRLGSGTVEGYLRNHETIVTETGKNGPVPGRTTAAAAARR